MGTAEEKLVEICKAFITEHRIRWPEQIYDTDKIAEESPYLIQQICDTIGYFEGNIDDE